MVVCAKQKLVTLIKNSIARGWLLMVIANLWIMEVVMMLVIEVMVVAVLICQCFPKVCDN